MLLATQMWRRGYLLGARHYTCAVDYFEPGATYRVTCSELVRDSQGMGSFACRIEREGTCLAQANLAVLEQPREKKLGE